MASTTISISAGTWNRTSDNVNHSSDSWLRSSLFPYYNSTDGGGYFAFLQFAIPNTLKYKHIKKVQLSYYTKLVINGTAQNMRSFDGLTVSPYVASGTALSNVKGNSVDTYGEVGTPVKISPYEDWVGAIYPLWRTQDVTALFESNLYNNQYFTIILYSAPGGPSERVTVSPSVYAEIGGVGSGYAAYLTIDYEDVPQAAPGPAYPVGTYVNENTDLLFSWAWNSSTQAVQAAVQLEYKLASAQSYTVVSLTQTAHSYTLVGGLPQGAYVWRIKGPNDAGETSDYSNVAEFTVIGKPGVPVINTPANKALTEITWQASDQNSFDITLTDSQGRELIKESVASSATNYKPNLLLKGTYTVGIRYRNSSGLASDWAYKVFSITAAGPTKPSLTLYGEAENARLVITRESNINYVVMRAEDETREFEIIGVFDADTYIDKTAKFNTGYSYKIRAFESAGYTDSDVAHFRCNSEKVAIQTADLDIFLDRSEEEFLPYNEEATREMATYKCPGRQYAIVEHSESDEVIFSTSLFVTEKQKAEVTEIAKEDYIYYRDYSKRAFPVAIRRLSFSRFMKEGYIANIEFIRIAKKEVVINV
jgi:hypothetical protein